MTSFKAYLYDAAPGSSYPYEGIPHDLLLRLPSWSGTAWVPAVIEAVDKARTNPSEDLHDAVVDYGIFVRCERGAIVGPDQDHDGFPDSEDCCPSNPSFLNDCTDGDHDGVADSCDNCDPDNCAVPTDCYNPDQLDFDGDGKGLVCDEDNDGDRVRDEYDCDPYNALLTWDVDQDTICEKPPTDEASINSCRSICVMRRSQVVQSYGEVPLEWQDYYDQCLARCEAWPDNCADGIVDYQSDACEDVRQILETGGTAADDLDNSFALCRELYWNQDQEREPGHGVGVRCETGATSLVFEPERALTEDEDGLPLNCSPDVYSVEFHANSADIDTIGEPMRDTSVESCGCDVLDGLTLDWDPICYTGDCNRTSRARWNPIRDPVFNGGGSHFTAYPFGTSVAPARQQFVYDHEMGRDRTVNFRRRATKANHTFHWNLRTSKHYPYPFPPTPTEPPVEDLLSNPMKLYRTRVSWRPEVDVVSDADFEANQVRLSKKSHSFQNFDICWEPNFPREFDELWWMHENPVAIEKGWLDPSPIGWVALSAADGLHLVTFDRSFARPSAVQAFTYVPGSDAIPNLASCVTTAGIFDSGLIAQSFGRVAAQFAYQPGISSSTTAPRGILWIGLVGATDNLWLTSEQAFGDSVDDAPSLDEPHLFFDEHGQALYLLGIERGDIGSDQLPLSGVLWKLDFTSGTWSRLGQIPAVRNRFGVSLAFDPLSRTLYVAGGTLNGVETGQVIAVRLEGLATRVVAEGDAATVGRRDAGIHLDPLGQTLYLVGGARGDAVLGDAWSLSLVRGEWSMIGTGASGPGPRLAPMVSFDRRSGKLWIAGGTPGIVETELRPRELDPTTGLWVERRSLASSNAPSGRREGSFSSDAPPKYTIHIPASAPPEGELWMAELTASSAGLAILVEDAAGTIVARDDRTAEVLRVSFFGQADERYTVRVVAGTAYSGATIPFTLRLRPASLVLAAELSGLPDVTSVSVLGDHTYVGHGFWITPVDVSAPEAPVMQSPFFTGGLVQEVVTFGAHHVAATQTLGAEDLVILDVADPAHPARLAGLPLGGGPCRGLTAREGLLYLACGAKVKVVNVRRPEAPVLMDTWSFGGAVTEVRVSGRWLVVGLASGRIQVLDITSGSSPVLRAEARTDRRPVQTFVSGDRIHVAEVSGLKWGLCLAGIRCGFGSLTEVLEIDQAAGTALQVGSYGADHLDVPYAAFGAGVVVEPTLLGIRVFQAEALP